MATTNPQRIRVFTEEHKKKLREARKGKTPTLGCTHSDETRQKCRLAKLGEKNPNFGKHPSEETLKKMSDVQKGTHHTVPKLIHHHTKYKEIHGVDEVVLLTPSEHRKLHNKLRKEGKCNVPAQNLKKISKSANARRISGDGGRTRQT